MREVRGESKGVEGCFVGILYEIRNYRIARMSDGKMTKSSIDDFDFDRLLILINNTTSHQSVDHRPG